MLTAIWVLWIPLVLAGPSGDDPRDDFAEAHGAAVKGLVERLDGFADWCTKCRLFAERDRAWLAILRLDPKHTEAHKGLGHRRGKDGGWRENTKRRPPRNRDETHLAEVPERWSQTLGPFRDRMLELLELHAETLSAADRDAVFGEILAFDPDDAKVRELLGEVKLGERWVLPETASGKKRRPELKLFVREGFEQAPRPKEVEPNEREVGLGVAWKTAWATPLVRVLATGDEREAVDAALAIHAARELFNKSLGVDAKYPKDFGAFLLANPGEKTILLDNHRGVDKRNRPFLERVEGAGIPMTGDFCHWANNAPQRKDGIVRISLGWLFRDAFDITTRHGWIHEGFGLYMTRSIAGTRLNWFAKPSRYLPRAEDDAFRAHLYDSGTNWMNEAHEMLQGEKRPELSALIGKDVNGLTSEELLFAYVTAAYLLEGRPAETPELLRRIGAGESQVAVFKMVLGMDVDELDARVQRWLSERR